MAVSRMQFARAAGLGGTLFVVVLSGLLAAGTTSANQAPPADAPAKASAADAATRQYAAAVALQNRELYELAADEWTKFLDSYSQDARASRARHYRGVCHLKDKRYEPAIADFQKVIESDPKFPLSAATYLNLGLAQYSLAQGGAVERFRPAADAFAALTSKFPASEYAPQATFYRGEALYAAGDKPAAVREYQSFAKLFPQHALLPDALYALGVAQEESRDASVAEKTFATLLEKFPQHRLAGEVQLRRGELLLAAGKAADAEKVFAAAAATPNFPLADTAWMRRAAAQYEQKLHREAAASYLHVAKEFPDSKQRTPAQLSAGKSLFLAGDHAAARETLASIEATGAAGLEAAHWIAQCWLKERNAEQALAAAEQGLSIGGESPVRASLEFDRAEALSLLPERRAEAVQAYASLARTRPDDPLAPQALYLAAFTSLEAGEFAAANDTAKRFLLQYDKHALLPDVIAIYAESMLQLGKLADAAQTYASLLKKHGQHRDALPWRLRLAWCHYLQKQFRETVATLVPQLESLPPGPARAETQFLIGSSLAESRQPAEASAAFADAWRSDPQWRQGDELLLAWSAVERQSHQPDRARQHLQTLLKEFPQSRLLDRAYYRLGEIAYGQEDFAAAVEAYGRVVAGWLNSPVLPAARLGLGLSELGRGDPAKAAQVFTQLIDGAPPKSAAQPGDGMPNGELIPRARYARALARHQLKEYASAAEDLQAVLAAGQQPERADTQYLLGLCLAAEGKPAEAALAWKTLLAESPRYPSADKALYELAWALKGDNQPDEATAAFEQLATAHPQSPLAAESSYHVGEAAYARSEWDAAAAAYQQALERAQAADAKSPVAEQAAHKLAWTLFKQGELDRSAEAFAKQRSAWPEGSLAPDAQFMQGEILFKQEKYEPALAVYNDLPKLSNPDLHALALLHAGQAAAKLKDWNRSLKLLEQCLTEFPESTSLPETLYEKAWAQQNLGALDEALATYEQVTAKTDREVAARARFMVGEIYFDKQDHKEAVRNFFKVAYSYGYPAWQASAHYEAGRCFEVLGKPEQAKKSYEELVKQFPDSERAAAAKERLAALTGGKS